MITWDVNVLYYKAGFYIMSNCNDCDFCGSSRLYADCENGLTLENNINPQNQYSIDININGIIDTTFIFNPSYYTSDPNYRG
jgi:hypothetical protein